MRKRYIWIMAAAAALTAGVVLFRTGAASIRRQAAVTTIVCGDFQPIYELAASVSADPSPHYLPGTMVSLAVTVGQTVVKGQTLAEYLDALGRRRRLTSTIAGLVTAADTSSIPAASARLWIMAYVPAAIRRQLAVGGAASFSSQGRTYRCHVGSLGLMAEGPDGAQRFAVRLTLDGGEGLLWGQDGTAVIELPAMTGVLTVSRHALYQDEAGSFVVAADWLADLDHPAAYRHQVTVVAADTQQAVVQGVGLQDMTVVVWDQRLRSIWAMH